MMKFLEAIPGWGIVAWLWNNRMLVTIAATLGLIGWQAWQLDAKRDKITELKADKVLLETVVKEHENAAREMDRKVTNDKENAGIAVDSAAAVAAGRLTADGPMAGVLRTEYERVRLLADKARNQNDSR